MSTNYYAVIEPCPTCGRGDEIHIAKTEHGWRMAVEVQPEHFDTWNGLLRFLLREDVSIRSETGQITFEEFLKTAYLHEKKQPHMTTDVKQDGPVDLLFHEFS